jgi:hypothetical protein
MISNPLCTLPVIQHQLGDKSENRVRRERRWSTAGVNPPGNWFAPPGSNQSSSVRAQHKSKLVDTFCFVGAEGRESGML